MPSAQRPSPRVRFGGFSLVEVVVSLAILLILASVVAPSLVAYLDRTRAEEAVARITLLANGVFDNTAAKLGFYQKVGAHPGKLSQLTNQITTVQATHPDLCGNAFSNGEVNQWNANAPFVNFYIDPTGVQTGIGIANDVLTRTKIPPALTTWSSRIDIPNADEVDAIEIDAIGDTGNGRLAGFIQWTVPAGGIVTISVYVPINNAC